ncbi:diguanylate cyclase [uncultured Tateyamaria sp.]|uniref:diguanylate cyclase n=1 Tax=Tateyamaria sp. 1078 TaxID=3417464 RepID=UPI00262CA030|nr:diguanylate cyclase [uncultured Tateyamaria sp.]
MHGKVLVIDPIATHRIVLRVKLAASQYEVLQATSIAEGMRVVGQRQPDLILCSTSLPDGRPEKVLARLRKVGLFGKVPVIALGGPTDPKRRLRLLEAGYDDVLIRPVDHPLLLARARSLLRSYASTSEWQLREGTSRALGFAEHSAQFGPAACIRVVTRTPHLHTEWKQALAPLLPAKTSVCLPAEAVQAELDGSIPDAFLLITTPGRDHETLSLLASLRSHASTRHSVIMVAQEEAPAQLGAQMLDMGANDLAPHGATLEEIAVRLRTLLARKMMTDALRATVRTGIEAAVIDPLTGLHNRRYAMPHVTRIAERAQRTGKSFALMIADMDHFKQINDRYGHAAGDAVLIEVARRLRSNLRAVDMVARIGGEEFLMALPGVGLENARSAATRLCRKIGTTSIAIPGHPTPINATISIGMIVCDMENGLPKGTLMTAEALLDRADQALYDAKAEGRNRVTLCRPAA